MKIQRIIDGISHTFELTPEELEEAYNEEQKILDCYDLENYGLSPYIESAEDFEKKLGCTPEEYLEWKEEIAEEMRGLINMQDLSMPEARDKAIWTVVGRHKNS